ncbi:FimV/HubP family polar landmark protein [Vibrio campbellii]|uniref:FimV/HubP family polar landmark protein n=1 Tax=Vibrio campbellii TaxID=680 RepID=UPI0009A4847A|nr:FimV/HubP family polar landmark protein [Vibrio campbellii]OPH51047.1 AAA family ATPase [Vibrio campbellii]
MRQNYKRLLAALVLMSATQTSSVVQAEGIRLVGPSGEVQASPSYAEEIERALPAPPENDQPSRFFGPTGQNETLWSIASELRPSRNVSVQQTLLAIYRINPQAFDKQNIHELIPGSRLRVPSLEQVQSATTEQAVAIMKAHEARLTQPKPKPAQPVKPRVEQPKPVTEVAKPEPKPETVKPELPKPQPIKVVEPTTPVPAVTTSPEGEKQISELKDKLQGSHSELESLEEKNHRLRLMLSEVQSEVETLKTSLNDEERIRSEVEKLLAEERQRVAEQQRMQPSTMDKILSNGWLVGLAALIPGALIALLVVMLLGRRSKAKEEEAATQEQQNVDPLAAPIGLAAADELDEELSLDDDLFGDDDETENLFGQEEQQPEEEDVFGNLDDDDLDFNLEGDDGEDPFAGIGDDGELDVGFDEFDSSSNGIKVNGEEKALGLEEMERALDEVTPELEVLDDDDDAGFDLSDEDGSDALSDDAFAELLAADEPAEALQNDAVDQAMLDDLFADLDGDDLNLDVEDDKSAVSESAFSAGEATDDDIDKLLAQYEQPTSGESDEDVFDELEALSGLTENDSNEEDASALLDELIGEDDGESLNELDPLQELEDIAGLSEEPTIDEDSTDLLDELIGFEDEDSTDDDFDPLDELEKLSGFDGDDTLEDIDENSVDLLDELLSDESVEEEQNETSSEIDPFDELIREDDETEQTAATQSDDDLLASLGFDDLEPAVEEALPQSQPVMDAKPVVDLEDEKAALGLDSGLDIDALLSENQPEAETQSLEQASNDELDSEAAESNADFDSNDFLGDLEDASPEHDPLMTELDELFESNNEALLPSEQERSDFAAELDALIGEEESETDTEEQQFEAPTQDSEVTENTLEEHSSELPEALAPQEETIVEPDAELAPAFTPTPNTVENEFGIPQEEDWLVDEIESESKVEQEPVAASSTESAIDEEEFNFDELELPEFNEEDALASMADEPALAESEIAEPQAPVAKAEEEFNFDELELPEFNEEDALASMAEEPALAESEISEPEAPAEEEFSFDELELPEFNEEDALASMAEEPALAESETVEPEASVAEAEEEFNFDELELPEFNEEDALASMAEEPTLEESETAEPEASVAQAEEEFNFDELELPEFNEEDALASMAEEPTLAESETAGPAAPVVEAEEEFNFDELELPEFNEEDALASMADEPALAESEISEPQTPVAEAEEEFNFDDFELPEFNEEDALASVTEEVASSDSDTVEPEVVKEHSEVSQAVQQAENDHDALFEVFAQPEAFSADLEPEPSNDLESELNDFEESAMANLLSENAESEVFDGKLDSDTIASAGMDFETMLDVGDDWDGFKLSPENTSSTAEVPEDQREVWSSTEALAQPEIAQENWGEQDDLTDFDPKKNQFMTIDELMAQVDKDGGEFEEQELKLDVGLNEFPDVIGDIGDVDVDTNAEAAGKLDLAKIYLEMNDPQGAIKLLEEAIVYGEDDIRREAKSLIDTINGR